MNIVENFQQHPFEKIIQLLLIIGAINWGFVAYNGMDFVRNLTYMVNPSFDRYLKLAVGLAGVYMLYKLIIAPAPIQYKKMT